MKKTIAITFIIIILIFLLPILFTNRRTFDTSSKIEKEQEINIVNILK